MSDRILVFDCGVVPYRETVDLQSRLEGERRREEIPDTLLLLQHPPVYTRGRRSGPEELPMGTEWYEAQGIEVVDTPRGGRVTYHGPGQLVAYPIVSLRPYGDDVRGYVRGLERAAIAALGEHGVPTRTIEGLTGIWTEGARPGDPGEPAPDIPPGEEMARKIGQIGIHVSHGVTTHGMAINVNNDLQPFEWVVPCGIDNCRVTSLSRELGAERDLGTVADTVAARYAAIFGRTPVETAPGALGLDLARLGVP